LGAGAYICGEETSLLESLEGKRAIVRAKPPLPALQGLFGKPTIVNNVLSSPRCPSSSPVGPRPMPRSAPAARAARLPVQLGGNVRRGGLIEVAFGVSLREIVEELGGGTLSGRPIRAVQVGGPLGAYLPEKLLDTPIDYEALAGIRAMLGHGGIVVFDDTVDMAEAGALRLRLLRRGELRQVHALPDRRDPRRRTDGPDPGRHRARDEPRRARRSVPADDRRLALRHGRPHPDAGDRAPSTISPRISTARRHARLRPSEGHRHVA
jgi:hypothetical protein